MPNGRERDLQYKDELRHGGKRSELLAEFGPVCSSCGITTEERDIAAHHVTGNPKDHSLQILLCRSCHAVLHMDGVDKKPRTEREIRFAVLHSSNLDDAARAVDLSVSALKKRIKRYSIGKSCENCKKEFIPTPALKKYCSEECAITGKKEKWQKRMSTYTEQKTENDRKYREAHKEKLAESKRQYYLEHAEIFKARSKVWHEKHKTKSSLPGAVA